MTQTIQKIYSHFSNRLKDENLVQIYSFYPSNNDPGFRFYIMNITSMLSGLSQHIDTTSLFIGQTSSTVIKELKESGESIPILAHAQSFNDYYQTPNKSIVFKTSQEQLNMSFKGKFNFFPTIIGKDSARSPIPVI